MAGGITLRVAAVMMLLFAAQMDAASEDHSTAVKSVHWQAKGW